MASENETVADIVTEMHRLSRATIRNGLNVKDDPLHAVRKSACAVVHMFANRIESAHRREVAELREFAEFVKELYCGCTCKTTYEEREDGCCNQCEFGEKLRKALEGGIK